MSTVYLVGAGPGDASLISVRGLRCLERADVVVYDHLVSSRLLAAAPARAERIDVGAAAPQPLEQDAICLLLAEKAREGRTVVRLKWGDPFFFDSGGKEAIFLHEQGIRFEVVPGVPATIAVPSYAGVPLTYPGAGETVTFVRGHEDGSSHPPRIDWASLAKLEGTIACYAGARQIPGILRSLVEEGRPPADMAAIVLGGTLPDQQTLCGTLEELSQRLAAEPLKGPGIVVVGAVAGLREHLRWFDARPLFGKRVVVTRAREQVADLVERLEELGAQAIEAAAFRIEPAADQSALDAACARAHEFDWIVFTSQNAVEQFMRRLMAGPGDVRSLKGPKLCAVGPVTAERLARFGLKVDVVPAEHRAERAAEAMAAKGDLAGRTVLYPKSEMARDVLADDLRKAGAMVTAVTAYRTVPEPTREGTPDIYKMLLERQIAAVTFTSASSVRYFVKTLGEDQAADLLSSTVVASIGPVTAEAAQQLGINSSVVAKEYTGAGLVQALVDYFREAQGPARKTQAKGGA
jgi:uroporphyrinogen III methyltransferase/synthase